MSRNFSQNSENGIFALKRVLKGGFDRWQLALDQETLSVRDTTDPEAACESRFGALAGPHR